MLEHIGQPKHFREPKWVERRSVLGRKHWAGGGDEQGSPLLMEQFGFQWGIITTPNLGEKAEIGNG